VDLDHDIVYGIADTNDEVMVFTGPSPSSELYAMRKTTVVDGKWSVDFSKPVPGGAYEETVIVDLTPTNGGVSADLNRNTEVNWPTNKKKLVFEEGRIVFLENARIEIPADPNRISSLEVNVGESGSVFQYNTTDPNTLNQVVLNAAMSATISAPAGTSFEGNPATVTLEWPDANNDGIVDETTIKEADLYISKNGWIIAGPCSSDPNCDSDANTFSVDVTSLSYFVIGSPITYNLFLPLILR
jgi:hypothetical protein